ncbi:molybdopterin-guanine dinucleotide biosynthesis protein B [Iodobacter sp. HSC-16F04]|uniref:Molybdopterin-guanine dinucleotide biosynthesis protein B n=1 Tax=Iodobacter violaceini TaxID=3044271 RepID=A0ABX0KS45_9NEIS|nr:molybdopterin-guanine dinucleotide biosynthesis protein B [Iodobacter violacea]NHQ87473.1 molybdopterin-guanine dinucleotide biosynthesis protein B [Iodobacter violacea]
MTATHTPFVLGIAGWSGSGKTTLIEKLLPELVRLGLSVSVIKYTHHPVQFEPEGKDTSRFRAAGAGEVLLATPHGFALIHEGALPLHEMLARLAPVDLVLVEGFKAAAIPKIEVRRADYPALDDPHIIAIASDYSLESALPLFDLNQAAEIAAFIAASCHAGF